MDRSPTRIPVALLLLPLGLLAGDVFGLVDPEALLGDLLYPTVSLLVALLLFQSGLQLRFADLPDSARSPVVRLLTGGHCDHLPGCLACRPLIMDLDVGLAFLLGAIVVVSGPTVVGPLLSSVRARSPLGSVLNYEGTFLDPIGATLGVVVLTVVLAEERGDVHPVLYFLGRTRAGCCRRAGGAAVMVFVMSRFWLTFKMESGGGADVRGGRVRARRRAAFRVGPVRGSDAWRRPRQPAEGEPRPGQVFGETLEVLIIAALFILLGALVTLDGLREYVWEIVLLVALLVIVVRPVTAFVSLLGTKLGWRDRALIGSIDPRGIVAASTAAAFTGSLAAAGFDSDFLLPVVFGVILGTGIIYGLAAKPVARLLGVVRPPARGIGLVGDAQWLLDLATQLQGPRVTVLVVTAKSPKDAQNWTRPATESPRSPCAIPGRGSERRSRRRHRRGGPLRPLQPRVNLLRFADDRDHGTPQGVPPARSGMRPTFAWRHAVADRGAHPFAPGVDPAGRHLQGGCRCGGQGDRPACRPMTGATCCGEPGRLGESPAGQ